MTFEDRKEIGKISYTASGISATLYTGNVLVLTHETDKVRFPISLALPSTLADNAPEWISLNTHSSGEMVELQARQGNAIEARLIVDLKRIYDSENYIQWYANCEKYMDRYANLSPDELFSLLLTNGQRLGYFPPTNLHILIDYQHRVYINVVNSIGIFREYPTPIKGCWNNMFIKNDCLYVEELNKDDFSVKRIVIKDLTAPDWDVCFNIDDESELFTGTSDELLERRSFPKCIILTDIVPDVDSTSLDTLTIANLNVVLDAGLGVYIGHNPVNNKEQTVYYLCDLPHDLPWSFITASKTPNVIRTCARDEAGNFLATAISYDNGWHWTVVRNKT